MPKINNSFPLALEGDNYSLEASVWTTMDIPYMFIPSCFPNAIIIKTKQKMM